jgi:hypothetical protein
LIFLLNRRIFEMVWGYHFFGRKGGGPPLFLTYDPLCSRAMFFLSPLIETRRWPSEETKSAIDVNTFPSFEFLLVI